MRNAPSSSRRSISHSRNIGADHASEGTRLERNHGVPEIRGSPKQREHLDVSCVKAEDNRIDDD
jgi:hypothetical protein